MQICNQNKKLITSKTLSKIDLHLLINILKELLSSLDEDKANNAKIIKKIISLFETNIDNYNLLKIFFNTFKTFLTNNNINVTLIILSTITEICKINPNKFHVLSDKILSIYQSSITDENLQHFTQISEYFGSLTNVLLERLNNYNKDGNLILANMSINKLKSSETYSKNFTDNEILLLNTFDKLRNFCIFNIDINSNTNQFFGIICLTSFIEKCSFNYINEENLETIFNVLYSKISDSSFNGKLEVLNGFISLIYAAEKKFSPFANSTLLKIIDFVENPEWLIRKFSLDIIYSLIYFCEKEIFPYKELILNALSSIKNEQIEEIKEIKEQIISSLEQIKCNHNSIDLNLKNNINIKIINKKCQLVNNNKNEHLSSLSHFESQIYINPINKKSKNRLSAYIKKKSPKYDHHCFSGIKSKRANTNIGNETKIIYQKTNNLKDLNRNKIYIHKIFRNRLKNPANIIKERKLSDDLDYNQNLFNTQSTIGHNFYDKSIDNKNINNIIILNNLPKYKEISVNKKKDFNKKRSRNYGKDGVINYSINSEGEESCSFNKTIYFQTSKNCSDKKMNLINKNKTNQCTTEREYDNPFNFNNKSLSNLPNRSKFKSLIKINGTLKKKISNKNKSKFCDENPFRSEKNEIILNLPSSKDDIEKVKSLSRNPNEMPLPSLARKIKIPRSKSKYSRFNFPNPCKFRVKNVETEFVEYKNETTKIIDNLINKVNLLEKSLTKFNKNANKNNEINLCIKSENFDEAFKIAINTKNLQNVLYVLKKYQIYLSDNKAKENKKIKQLKNEVLAEIIDILFEDILMCGNLKLINMFIKENVCSKKIKFEKPLKNKIINAYKYLYDNKSVLCFSQKDALEICDIINYFSN